DRNGEFRTQAERLPGLAFGQEDAAAQILARHVEERVGRLQHRNLGARRPALIEQREDVGGKGWQALDHCAPLCSAFCASRTPRTAATSSSSLAENWAGRLARHSVLSVISAAALAPATRSLIWTSPLARSSPPWMKTQGAPRLSAYFIWAFMPEPPRYISARMPALRRSDTIFW